MNIFDKIGLWLKSQWQKIKDLFSSNTDLIPIPTTTPAPTTPAPTTPAPTTPAPIPETGLPPLQPINFTEVNGVISMEAENCTSQTGYGRYLNAGASKGSVMRADGPTGSQLNFKFSVKQSGLWYLWIRAYSTNHLNNGLILKLNGSVLKAPSSHPLSGASDVYLRKTGWSWEPEWLKNESHSGPITLQLPLGDNILSIVKRKVENPLIDKIILTRVNKAPSGFGS